MNTSLQSLWISILLVIVLLFSTCGNENTVEPSDLVGRWEITQAMRSGKMTTTMDQMFFDFKEGGELITNMAGQEETYQYALENNTIVQREGIIEADYEILHFATDSLVLRSTIRRQLFELTLRQIQ